MKAVTLHAEASNRWPQGNLYHMDAV